MTISNIRVVLAFLIAPISVPLLLVVAGISGGGVVYYEFTLAFGACIAYAATVVFGLPAYLLYFRKMERTKFLPYLHFVIFCTVVFTVFWCWFLAVEDGLDALLDPVSYGASLLFFVFAGISVFIFYLIAFFKLNRS